MSSYFATNRTSSSYMYTITDLSDGNPELVSTRKAIRESNDVHGGTQFRVCVKYRLGKNNPNAHLYHGRSCYSVLKAHAQHADVYIYEKN